MSLHPWLTGQLATEHLEDLEREAEVRRALVAAGRRSTRRREHRRSALARRLGVFLIATGSRLTDGEGLRAAFDHGPRS
ncbi:MAG TPA: hypothetical protein VMF60_00030 [Acidimicrobiales bacterium]|nr:hypothetical protein [Acidimicrobiales bacterium]